MYVVQASFYMKHDVIFDQITDWRFFGNRIGKTPTQNGTEFVNAIVVSKSLCDVKKESNQNGACVV